MSQFLASGGQICSISFTICPSNKHSGLISFRMDWLNLLAVQGTLKSLLQHHDSKASILQCWVFFIVQLSHQYKTPGKTIALTRWSLVNKLMSLLYNMLSRLLLSSNEQSSFNFMAAVTICSDFGAQENKVCHCFHCFPIYLPWSDGTGCHDISILNVYSLKPAFSLSSFSFIKRLFSSSLSAIRVVLPAYLRLLLFLPEILIPACASSSPALLMMYSAFKLNKQGDNLDVLLSQFGTSMLFHVQF